MERLLRWMPERLRSPISRLMARRVMKEVMWGYVGKGFALVFGAAYTVVLSRMGPREYGVFGLCLSASEFVMVGVNLGVLVSMSRFLGEHRETDRRLVSRILGDAATLRFWIVLAGLLVAWPVLDLAVTAAGHPELRPYKLPLLLLVLGTETVRYCERAFEGLHRQVFTAVVLFLQHFVKFALVAGIFLLGGLTVARALGAFSLSMFVAGAAGAAVLFLCFFRWTEYRSAPSFKKAILGYALPLSIPFVGITVLQNADNVLLWLLSTDLELGYYTAAKQVCVYLPILVAPLAAGIAPRFAGADRERAGDLRRLFRRTVLYAMLVMGTVGLFLGLFAPWLVKALFKSPYLPAVPALRWLAAYAVLLALFELEFAVLNYLGKAGWGGRIILGTVALGLVLNVLLIPRYGATGAAMAAAATYFPPVVLEVFLVTWYLGKLRGPRHRARSEANA